MHFLLGFHYHYLGYPTQAARELEKAVQLAPKDESAKKLLDSIHGTSAPAPPAPAVPQPAPAPIDPGQDNDQTTARWLSNSSAGEPVLCARLRNRLL